MNELLSQLTPNRKALKVKTSRAKTIRRFHKIPRLVFARESRLTSYAGLVVFQSLFARLGLKARLRSCFDCPGAQAIFRPGGVMLLLVVHLLLGFRRLRGLEYYRGDPLVARVLGWSKLPEVSTVSRSLAAMDEGHVDAVRSLLRQLVTDRLASEPIARVTVDFDGSVQSTTGHAEGTAVGFNKVKKGARSYYPLFCTVAQTGQFFDMHHRPGNVHDSNGAPEFMARCLDELRAALPGKRFEARIDSAFFNDTVFPTLDAAGVEFTCSVPFQRFSELKTMIEHRDLWHRIDERWSYFECAWHPKCWKRSYRFIFLRQRRAVREQGPLQLDLFEPVSHEYEYSVIATNKLQHARTVLLFHHGRGSQEKIFGEAKQHAAVDVLATRRRTGNQIFTLAGMLAHNLARELQMVGRRPAKTALPKRPASWLFHDLGTIRQRLLHRAGILTRPQGELTLTVGAQPRVQNEMLDLLERLNNAA